MSGKWDDPSVPKRGWTFHEMDDLGDLDGVCEMCEVKEIRYVHYMSHPDWPHVLGCGCVCAGHMEEDINRARVREAGFKRQRSWLRRKWRQQGNAEHLNSEGYRIVVAPRGSAWGAYIEHRASGRRRSSQQPYASPEEAKLAVLDVLVRHKARTKKGPASGR